MFAFALVIAFICTLVVYRHFKNVRHWNKVSEHIVQSYQRAHDGTRTEFGTMSERVKYLRMRQCQIYNIVEQYDMKGAQKRWRLIRHSDSLHAMKANFILHELHTILTSAGFQQDDYILAMRGSVNTQENIPGKNRGPCRKGTLGSDLDFNFMIVNWRGKSMDDVASMTLRALVPFQYRRHSNYSRDAESVGNKHLVFTNDDVSTPWGTVPVDVKIRAPGYHLTDAQYESNAPAEWERVLVTEIKSNVTGRAYKLFKMGLYSTRHAISTDEWTLLEPLTY